MVIVATLFNRMVLIPPDWAFQYLLQQSKIVVAVCQSHCTGSIVLSGCTNVPLALWLLNHVVATKLQRQFPRLLVRGLRTAGSA